jgi:hypothetical protein
MATAAQRMDKLEESLAAIAGMLAAQNTPQDTEDEPATPKSKAAATTAKAGTIKRQLDPVEVEGPDGFTFTVVASNASGLLVNGARVVTALEGRVMRSLTLDAVMALGACADEIAEAHDTVEKRAKIGSHKVTAK